MGANLGVKVRNLLASIAFGLFALAYHFWRDQHKVCLVVSVRHKSNYVRAWSKNVQLAGVGDCLKVVESASRRASNLSCSC